MSEIISHNSKENIESQIAAMLDARFGDGLTTYQPKISSRLLFKKAVDMGFMDDEGYLTRKGRSLLTKYRFHH